MKKRTWIFLALICLCLVVFFCYRTVKRMRADTVAPQIHISSDVLQLSVQASDDELLQGVTAKDNKDGDVTGSVVVESIRLADPDGTASVTYAAFDRAGNVTKASRQVKYTDYESPRFALKAPLVFAQNSSVEVLSLIRATDLLDGDITRRIRATSLTENAINSLGTHDVEFRTTNSLGDTVELILPVEVYPVGTYQASLKLTDYLIYLPAGADFDPRDYLDSFTMGGEDTSLKYGIPQTLSLRTTGTVNTKTPGVYSIGYTVTYKADSTGGREEGRTYSGYSKLIVVVEE